MDRCHLKGQTGNAIHAVLCAAGDKIKWLLPMVGKKGIRPFLFLPQAFGLGQRTKANRQSNRINPFEPYQSFRGLQNLRLKKLNYSGTTLKPLSTTFPILVTNNNSWLPFQ
jgi:hypothetical protein